MPEPKPDSTLPSKKGRNNKLAGQIGEYLVCAELGRRNIIATPFSGNVPAFDILAADELCRTVPIQVKASRGDNWPSDARDWMIISVDPITNAQKNLGKVKITNPDLIYVCVAIAAPESNSKDSFYILTKSQLQDVCIKTYSAWMDGKNWIRPKNPHSYDCRYWIKHVQQYEGNWKVIEDQLAATKFALEPEVSTKSAN